MNKSMRRIILILVVFLGIGNIVYSQNVQQEVVYLKNGSVIRGSIIVQVPNQSLKIQLSDGSIFVYKMDEIEKIGKENILRNNQTNSFVQESEITGYRGFIDLGYTVGTGDYGIGRIEATTSHGYQFNPYFFAGVGTGIHYMLEGANIPVIPFFADLRGNFLKGSIVPFIAFKFGYSCEINDGFYGCGFYAAPSAGVKFVMGQKTALNFSLGYSAQKDEGINSGGFSIKMGVEF